MKINRDQLDKIAHLSRLEYDEKDAEKILKDMNEIVTWVEKLQEVDTTDVEPLTSMSHEVNVLREGKVEPPLSHDIALSQAPKRNDHYFRVPKVLDQ